MAKADGTSNTIVWISLWEALVLATAYLGSMELAKELLVHWMATGDLPWHCIAWKPRDAEGLARWEERRRESEAWGHVPPVTIIPSAEYFDGDPQFWGADLKVDWENNLAREKVSWGAKALGNQVSREHLLALLPKKPREREQVQGVGAWIAVEVRRMKAANEIPPDIRITNLAHELERRLQKAAATNKSLRPIKWRSIKNKLPEWGLWPVTSIK